MKTRPISAEKVIADGSSLRKRNVNEDVRSGNRKRKTPTDHDYFHGDDNEERDIKVTIATGKTISLKMKGSDTIGRLKLMLEAKEGIPFGMQEMLFNNNVLKNINIIANLGIENQSTLTLLHSSVERMEVRVNISPVKTLPLGVYTTDTIADVKSKIKNIEGIPVDEQVLIFNNMVLGDTGTLFDFNILKKSMLTLLSKPRAFKGVMQIFIKTLIGETITEEVKTSDTVREVKAMIQGKVDIPVDEQELIFNDKALYNDNTLADCNIKCESTITLMRISTGLMHISIQAFARKTFTLDVKPSDTIYYVKSRIHVKEKVPPWDQNLIFEGQFLKDSATLADYNISNESTLFAMVS